MKSQTNLVCTTMITRKAQKVKNTVRKMHAHNHQVKRTVETTENLKNCKNTGT